MRHRCKPRQHRTGRSSAYGVAWPACVRGYGRIDIAVAVTPTMSIRPSLGGQKGPDQGRPALFEPGESRLRLPRRGSDETRASWSIAESAVSIATWPMSGERGY